MEEIRKIVREEIAHAAKIWLDDVRSAPEGYIWIKSVNEAIKFIVNCERKYAERHIEERVFDTSLLARYWDISCDTSDYLEFLNWLESTNRINLSFKLHGTNIVGAENMRKIIERNGWTEVK